MCEKAVVIGFYAVASGCFVNYSPAMNVLGSKNLTKFLTEEIAEVVGGKFNFESDPVKAAQLMMAHMDKKREALKLRPLMYAKSFLEQAPAVPETAPSAIKESAAL
jgi:carbon-monoxide dehydrogenase catalytic subunit